MTKNKITIQSMNQQQQEFPPSETPTGRDQEVIRCVMIQMASAKK